VSSRRPLAELLVEVADAVLVAARGAPGLRAKRVEVMLPIELTARPCAGETQLLGDVPRSRRASDFDLPTTRLVVIWEESGGP
jgi:hypothetical protein